MNKSTMFNYCMFIICSCFAFLIGAFVPDFIPAAEFYFMLVIIIVLAAIYKEIADIYKEIADYAENKGRRR